LRLGRRFAAILAVLIVILVAVSAFIIYNTASNQLCAGCAGQTQSSTNSATTIRTQNGSSSISLQSTFETSTVTLGTIASGGVVTQYSLHQACNCTVYIPQPIYPTLNQLVQASPTVWLANVTMETNLIVNGLPFMLYNISNIETLYSAATYKAPPGANASFAWIGGTVNETTMLASGYPTLIVGATYVFFFPTSAGYNLYPYWGYIEGGSALSTTGGAQGLYYVQGGNVFSLDNMYPQADAWLPVKLDGTPLAQFILELQSG